MTLQIISVLLRESRSKCELTVVISDNIVQIQLRVDLFALAVDESGFEDVVVFQLDVGSGGVETHCEKIGVEQEMLESNG
jgi:hypothetical protein